MKKSLFISYSTEDYNKVKLIIKELRDHKDFEVLVVANKREPNKALVDKVVEGINSSYCIIPILSISSIKAQWINQEIGYALGKGIKVLPIVEERIMLKLKGFVHKQNDLPYTYKAKKGMTIREEHKYFMTSFRLLINDLEFGLDRSLETPLTVQNQSAKNNSYYHVLEIPPDLRQEFGLVVSSGEKSPKSGNWRSFTSPRYFVQREKGEIMPKWKDYNVKWIFVE